MNVIAFQDFLPLLPQKIMTFVNVKVRDLLKGSLDQFRPNGQQKFGFQIPFDDINECSESSLAPICDVNVSKCTNNIGSYKCECNDGFEGDTCVDIDECATGTSSCSRHAQCKNTVGSFECKCAAGFHGDGVTCENIDECKDELHTCAEFAHCTEKGVKIFFVLIER